MSLPRSRRGVPAHVASLCLAAWLLLAGNVSFWRRLGAALQPLQAGDVALLAGVAAVLLLLFWTLLSLLAWPRVARPGWTLVLLLAAGAAYFMDRFGVMIDRYAIQSVFETDRREAFEWLGAAALPYALGALLPIFVVWRVPLAWAAPRTLALRNMALMGATAAALGLLAALAFPPLASLARNHRELPHLLNPTATVQATWGYARRRLAPADGPRLTVGADARVGPRWRGARRPHVLVIVVGESARASSFGLFGYARDTTPELARRDAIGFGQVEACGTSTAVSLPCLFSGLRAAQYEDGAARRRDTLLDVLRHAGLASQWFDNNTGSKGLQRADDEHDLPPGATDDVLVAELHRALERGAPPPVIVLHQLGSHGPGYFERYPPSFARFAPACASNDLGECTPPQIVNAYDNSILYTDHVLAGVIDELAAHAASIDGAMLYVSDHGESTGEHGFYLHGAPRLLAPREQTRVPIIAWLSDGFAARADVDRACLRARRAKPLSHDYFYHSVLGLLDVRTAVYDAGLDLFAACRGDAALAAH